MRLASRITDRAIDGLRNAWSSVCDLALKVTQVESNPQLVLRSEGSLPALRSRYAGRSRVLCGGLFGGKGSAVTGRIVYAAPICEKELLYEIWSVPFM